MIARRRSTKPPRLSRPDQGSVSDLRVIWVSASVRRRIPPDDPWFWRSQAGMACFFAFAVNAVSSPVWLEFGPVMGLCCALTHMAAARSHALLYFPLEEKE